MRDAIGAALQEAALDPNLTAREHMRLQGALHGMSKADRDQARQRADRARRPRGCGRPQGQRLLGGMKRRLDLALALLHGPRVLFLDEPTTGLDIQSRTALWDEVAHLSRDEGMTVFLTTQYLEEADQLADHLGIIDHGKIVAEGTTDALKAEVGRPTVEVVPADHAERDRAVELLRPFGELVPGTPQGAAVRLEQGSEELADIIRAFDRPDVKVANLELHEASLNDVFLTKTGRRWRVLRARPLPRAAPANSPLSRAHRPDGGRRRDAHIAPARCDRRSGPRCRSLPVARSCARFASPRRSSRRPSSP